MENNTDKTTIDISNESLEETIGYKLAIMFKPFIDPKCSEHMEIVKDMAKSINSTFNNADRKGRVFNKGYEEGKNWQKEKDKANHDKLVEALKGFLKVINRSNATQHHYGDAINNAEQLLQSIEQDI